MLLDHFPFLTAEAAHADARRLIMVRALSAFPPLAERLRRQESRVSWLPDLIDAQTPERILSAVPYFWLHIRQAFEVLAAPHPSATLDRFLDHLAIAALDSFAGNLDGFPSGRFPLPATQGAQMMRLGITFDEVLQPYSAEALGGGLRLYAGTGSFHISAPARVTRVPNSYPLRRIEDKAINLGNSEAQIENEEAAIDKFPSGIDRSVAWIADASPRCASLIAEEIQFVVPLRHDKSAHHSFTLSNLPGLLFVGGSDNLLQIVEAIVHETGHARLHHANEVYPLVSGPEQNRYYSPWRDDPRPPVGLIHGLYVFTLILLFWLDGLESGDLSLREDDRSYINSRIALIGSQVREAAAVLDQAELSPFGLQLLSTLRSLVPETADLPVPVVELESARYKLAAKRSIAMTQFPELVMPAL